MSCAPVLAAALVLLATPPLRGETAPPPSGAPQPPTTQTLENASYFFRAKDGTVLMLLSVGLLSAREGTGGRPAGDGAEYVGEVSVQETDRRGEPLPDALPRTVALEAAPPVEEGGRAGFFGRVYLHPGKTYAVRYAVTRGSRDEILVRNAVVGVPELTRGFSASSIVPAEQFGPARPAATRFQVGSEEVVPKVGETFRRSELLRLYLQVYDAALDSKTSTPRVDVAFRFFRSVNGRSKRYGKPFSVRGAAGASMGLALPIGDWPAGPYRVEVDLHDRVTEQRILAEGRFSIAED